ncbi:MAG: hypothetical protein H0W88_06875 [Parachlamydiaceae bacterium]|nr:hypothetical protein [Parachlamydiaceae bacterium]
MGFISLISNRDPLPRPLDPHANIKKKIEDIERNLTNFVSSNVNLNPQEKAKLLEQIKTRTIVAIEPSDSGLYKTFTATIVHPDIIKIKELLAQTEPTQKLLKDEITTKQEIRDVKLELVKDRKRLELLEERIDLARRKHPELFGKVTSAIGRRTLKLEREFFQTKSAIALNEKTLDELKVLLVEEDHRMRIPE